MENTKENLWIYHPTIDLLIGCGAWSLPLLLLANPFGNFDLQSLAITFYALSLVCNYPHYMATIYRAYGTKADFTKYRFFTLHLTACLVILGIFAHTSHKLLAIIFTVYLTWSPWHYMGQNFGLFMMFSRRANLNISNFDRTAIYLAFIASYLMLFFSFHTGDSQDPYILSLGIPPIIGRSAQITFLVMFFLTAGYGLFNLLRQAPLKLMIAPLVVLSTEFFWFVLPTILQLTNSIGSVPQVRYSTGVLAIMHSAQYLWITSYYAKKENSTADSNWRLLPYLLTLIIGGIALFVPGPWLVSYIFSYDFTTSFLIFTALINIHHFLLDGAIWKLRDSKISALLLNTQENLAALAEQTVWLAKLTSKNLAARSFRIAIIVLLLFLAGIDQTRFYFALKEGNLTFLSYAEKLNPNDATVKTRLALAKANATTTTETIESLKSALKLNPYDPEIQHRLAQMLIENQQFEEAYTHYQKMPSYVPLDANALINFGILTMQLKNNVSEAISYWQQATHLAPKELNPHIYLADTYFQQKEYLKAIPHYESFLLLSSEQPLELRPSPKQLVLIALKIAECYTQTQLPERALKYCQQAVKIAENSKDLTLNSFALIKLGEMYLAFENIEQAISNYQKALKLDELVKDNKLSAVDWFNYANLLAKANASETMIMTCLLKAESLLKGFPGPELDEILKAKEILLKSTGMETSKIEQDLDKFVEKAINLKP